MYANRILPPMKVNVAALLSILLEVPFSDFCFAMVVVSFD